MVTNREGHKIEFTNWELVRIMTEEKLESRIMTLVEIIGDHILDEERTRCYDISINAPDSDNPSDEIISKKIAKQINDGRFPVLKSKK